MILDSHTLTNRFFIFDIFIGRVNDCWVRQFYLIFTTDSKIHGSSCHDEPSQQRGPIDDEAFVGAKLRKEQQK